MTPSSRCRCLPAPERTRDLGSQKQRSRRDCAGFFVFPAIRYFALRVDFRAAFFAPVLRAPARFFVADLRAVFLAPALAVRFFVVDLRADEDFFAVRFFVADLRPAFFAAAMIVLSVRWDGVLPIPRWIGETAWG